MNSNDSPSNPAPEEPTGGQESEPNKKPRRHLLGLPPGYRFDPDARPTPDDLYGTPACFGDDEPLRRASTTAQPDGPPGG